MKGHNKKMELLGSAPIPKALLAMGIPTMIGMMISAIYNLVDAYFVGGLGTSQMGAISVTYPLSQVIVGLGLLFGNGAGSYISRLLGRGNNDDAKKVASTALYSGLLLGIIFIIGTLAFLEPILKFLGTTESIMPYAIKYARIFIAASIFNIFNVMMNNIITSEGAAKISMFAMLSGALLNMILDPIFINVLNMGVTGAAIASAIGQALSTVVFLSYILMKKSIFTFKIKDCCYSKENMKEILKIGVPTLVFQLLTSLSIILINNQANALSVTHTKEYVDSVIAGMGAVTRIVSMGSLMVFGFIKGFQPIAGYSYGAKNFKRLNESIKTSILWSTVFCALFGLILILFPATIISKFTAGDMELVRIGQASLRANGFSIMLFGFYTVYSSLFLALGKGLEGFILGACRQAICFVPIILLLPSLVGISGILYAQPIADLISAIITVFMAINLHKSLEKERLSYIKNKE